MESSNELCDGEVLDSVVVIDSLNAKSDGPKNDLQATSKDISKISGPPLSQNVPTIGVTIEQNKSCSSEASHSNDSGMVTVHHKSKSLIQTMGQCNETSTSQNVTTNAGCTNQNESGKQTADQSQSEIETEKKLANIAIENTYQLKLPDKPSLSQTDSTANISSNQNELGTDQQFPHPTDLFLTHVSGKFSTGKEMEIERNESSCTAQTTSVPEDGGNGTNIIPENSKPDSQADSVNDSHSNQDESENSQSSTRKEIKPAIHIANKAKNTSTPEYAVPLPSCSNSQKALESTSDKTVQEQETVFSTISKNTPVVDTQVATTSRNYDVNTITSETIRKSESSDMYAEVVLKSEFDAFRIPKVNIYGEEKGPKFYNVCDDFVSKPIIPTMLSEAFSALPIFGRPKKRSLLPEFQDEKIKEFVGSGLEDSEFERLADYCSPDNLRTGKELTMVTNPGQGFYPRETEILTKNVENFTSHHDLSIVRKHKLRTENDTKNLYAKRYKYRGIRMMSLGNDEDDNPVVTLGTSPVLPGKDLIFVIRWYRPFSYNPKDKNQYRTRHSVFSCNILMLGRHKLSTLRDRVVCPNDIDMRVDVSDTPDEIPTSTAKEMFPSGFLFINNVFYVDTRPGCTDYSLPLRRWARARGIGDFQCRDMCDVSMEQLPVRLAHPEVYVHQGNCEHLFTISEIRLVNASDPLKLSAYPCHTALSQNQTIYCTTCAEFGAKWIVVGCPRVPFDPAFFCERCFKLYLYKDGRKIGDFKAYLYRGNEINVLKPQG